MKTKPTRKQILRKYHSEYCSDGRRSLISILASLGSGTLKSQDIDCAALLNVTSAYFETFATPAGATVDYRWHHVGAQLELMGERPNMEATAAIELKKIGIELKAANPATLNKQTVDAVIQVVKKHLKYIEADIYLWRGLSVLAEIIEHTESIYRAYLHVELEKLLTD